jgi:hypothetical protein
MSVAINPVATRRKRSSAFAAFVTTAPITVAAATDRTTDPLTVQPLTDRMMPMQIKHLSLAEIANTHNDDSWIWKDDIMVWPEQEHPIVEAFFEMNADDCSDD